MNASAPHIHSWFSPGRVNVIGEHLDYNGGPSLPFAMDRGITVKIRTRDDNAVNVWSSLADGTRLKESFTAGVAQGAVSGWIAYVAGVVWALSENGHAVSGADIVLESTLPTGAGLASSAALTVGVAAAVADVNDLALSKLDIALVAHRAETEFVGAPTGLLDPLAITFAERGHAVLIQPSTEPPTTELRPLAIADSGYSFFIVDTGVKHSNAAGRYGERRAECETAAKQLQLPDLASAGLDAMFTLTDETLKSRVRHVVTETARVKAAVRAIHDRSWSQLGTILTASHASLRDDFAASCAELDVVVETALEADALGARMIGGGFGGSVLVLVSDDQSTTVAQKIIDQYEHLGWPRPAIFRTGPSAGCHRREPRSELRN